MSSSSKSAHFPNVPPPDGTRPASPYARFIPREELGAFSAWNPGALSGAGGACEPEPPPVVDADVQAQVAAARQAGYQDGYRDGLVALEGFKQSFAAQMSSQVGRLIDSIDGQFAALEEQMARAITQCALSLARQVVRAELSTNPEVVSKVAAEAVNAVLLSARHITVQAHPLDVALIEQGAADTLAARGSRVIANAAIERGGCRVESDLGAVDAGIDSRWAQACAAFGGEPQALNAAPDDGEDTST